MMNFVPQGKFAEGLNENGRKIGQVSFDILREALANFQFIVKVAKAKNFKYN